MESNRSSSYFIKSIILDRSNSKINERNENLWSYITKFIVKSENFYFSESSSRENEWTNFLFQLSKNLINFTSIDQRHNDFKKAENHRQLICDTIKKDWLDSFNSVNCTDSSYVFMM